MTLKLWPHHAWKLLRRGFFLNNRFWTLDFKLDLVRLTAGLVLQSLELSLMKSLIHYLSSWLLTWIIAGILLQHQKLLNFLADLWGTLYFYLLLPDGAIFVWRFIVNCILLGLLHINFNGLMWALSYDFGLRWCFLKTSSCSVVLLASWGQIADLWNALSAFGVRTFKQFNLLGKFYLLLLYYILLLLGSKLWHFKHVVVRCITIEILFGEKYWRPSAVSYRLYTRICLFGGFRVLGHTLTKNLVFFGPVALPTLVQWFALLWLIISWRLLFEIFYVTLLVAVFGLLWPKFHSLRLPTEYADVIGCVRTSREDIFAAPVCNLDTLVLIISKRREVLVLVGF